MTPPAGSDPRRLSQNIDRIVPARLRALLAAVLPAGSKEFINAVLRSRSLRWLEHFFEQRADRRYKQGKRPTSLAEIRIALQRLPLPNDTVVFVHSSMSKLGYIEGGAEAVVSALREVIVGERKSTLAVPTFSMSGGMADTLHDRKLFDVRNTPSGTGRITELIRRQPDAKRSLHPTHSVAAVGARAAWLVEAHHLDPRTFGPCSPFGRLVECGGFIMGLGVDLGPVTSYHVVEDMSAFPLAVYTDDSPIPATVIDERGTPVRINVMAHDPAISTTRIDRPNGAAIRSYLTTVFENAAGLTWYDIGDGRMWLVAARRFYECLDRLKDRGITIYATADEVASFPAPASVLRMS